MKRKAAIVLVILLAAPVAGAQGEVTDAPTQSPSDVSGGTADDPSSGMFFRVGAGSDVRSYHGVNLYSGSLELSLGGQGKDLGAFGTLGFGLGRTPAGLSGWQFFWSGSMLARFSPMYAGGTLRWAIVSIQRVTSTDGLTTFNLGLELFAGYELFAEEDTSIFFEARLAADLGDQHDPNKNERNAVLFPGAGLRVGARF